MDDTLRQWGLVIPKRLARRAVTRNLIRRQIRAALRRHGTGLPAGGWVVRLRAPFDPARYRSAASAALSTAVRQEIDAVLSALAQPAARQRPPGPGPDGAS